MAENTDASGPGPAEPDLDDPQQLEAAVREVSLRLMAGGVSRSTMKQLQKQLRETVGDHPWQDVTRRILAEPVDSQRLVQQGLSAQRDWVWRGGRETPGPSMGRRTKGFFARITAQMIFLSIWAVIVVAALLALRLKFPGFDIYRVLGWLHDMFPELIPAIG
jgi:hypothetical protein